MAFTGEYLFSNPQSIIPVNINSSKMGAETAMVKKEKISISKLKASARVSGTGINLVVNPAIGIDIPAINASVAITTMGMMRLFSILKLKFVSPVFRSLIVYAILNETPNANR